MDLFVALIVVLSLVLILTIILLIAVLNSFAPFRKMKDKELDNCYDLNNLRIYNRTNKKSQK